MDKPRQFILEVCKWIAEREEAKIHMDNILMSICYILDYDPGIPKIQHLQANITSLCSSIEDPIKQMGVGFLTFDYHTPPSPAQKKKGKSPPTLTSPRTRRGRASTRNLYVSPDDTRTLCGGLTKHLSGGKLCHNPP